MSVSESTGSRLPFQLAPIRVGGSVRWEVEGGLSFALAFAQVFEIVHKNVHNIARNLLSFMAKL